MRPTHQRSLVATLATCVAVGLVLPASAVAAAGTAPRTVTAAALAGTTLTPYALSGSSFGSKATGGDVNARSGRSAHAFIGCTKLAGKSRSNEVADVNLGNLGTASGVETRSWTTQQRTRNRGVAVSSISTSKVAVATVGELTITGLRVRTRAWHDNAGFHAQRNARIGGLALNGVAIPVPNAPGESVDVAGVGELSFLTGRRSAGAAGAWVIARGVTIKLEGTDSVVTLGAANSAISGKAPAGVLRGWGRAADATALDNAASAGKIAWQPMPCTGTNGKWKVNPTAAVNLSEQIRLGAASGSVFGEQTNARNAVARTRGQVSRISLDGGSVLIKGIRGQANVRKVRGDLKRSIRGTRIGSLTINGQEQELPRRGQTVQLRRLGTLTFAKRVPTRGNTVQVIAAQLELFDGTGGSTVVNLGVARAAITRS